jgi:outer membrane protein OmpA-like peptidoglycan-associated protein
MLFLKLKITIKMKRFKLFTICYFFISIYYAQIGELDRFDCNYSKEITIPFDFSETNSIIHPQLNQVVFYSYRDQFTYWYKITAKSNEKLIYSVTTINDSDSYVVYLYQYNSADFCKKLYSRNLKPITSPYYVGNGIQPNELSKNTIDIKKDNIYYISIVNTSLNNCGHNFKLSYGKDTLKVKAFHTPCKKDISTLSITEKIIKPITKVKDSIAILKPILATIIKDTIKINDPILKPISLNTKIELFVKDKKNLNLINANLSVTELDTKENKPLQNTIKGKWEMIYDVAKKYKIKCTALGYTDLQMTLEYNNTNIIELLLEPLKVGDIFIMKSIYFHPNTYALRKESAYDLGRLLEYMRNNSSVKIEIQGHTNGDNKIYKNKAYENLGEEWNFKGSSKTLSLKRAEAIKKYLINNGIDSERLIPVGQGGNKPIIENPETMEDGQRNIRVEVVILNN